MGIPLRILKARIIAASRQNKERKSKQRKKFEKLMDVRPAILNKTSCYNKDIVSPRLKKFDGCARD
jgi:hypothetical protein